LVLPSSAETRAGKAEAGLDESLFDLHASVVSRLNTSLSLRPPPEQAERSLRAVLPLCRQARITRLGDLTGLDRIGLPVVQAVRPAALSEVTSLGRGFSKAEAALGAVMEALERYFGETIAEERIFLATADELENADGLFDNLLVPERRGNWRDREIPWVAGLDVAKGAMHPVPLELVHTCYSEPPPPHDGLFLRTTTGLACHTSAGEALLHGLLECIERDAIARAFATHGFFDRMRIASSGLGERVDHILSIAGAHGISFALWLAPSPAGVPVVWCQTIETGPGEPVLALPTEGHAAGPNLESAASSAMLEALSARAGAISGARDDQTREHYRRSTDALVAKARALILDGETTMNTAEPSLAVPDLGSLLERVINAGLGPILAVPVGADAETGVHCVRTILPGAIPFFTLR
jgi:thiazole/oxazole-forming peptide maturase SagD family component